MTTRNLAVLFVLCTLFFACVNDCAAQSCVDTISILWINYVGTSPGWTCKGTDGNSALGVVICTRPKATCPPPHPPNAPCAQCKGAAGGHPINLSTGNTYIQETDIQIPGLGGGLVLERTWNSINTAPGWMRFTSTSETSGEGDLLNQGVTAPGLFGWNWHSTYEERISLGQDGYITYSRGDGSAWSFGYDSGSSTFQVAAPVDANATLSTDGTTTWTLTFKNGEQRVFSYVTGSLLSIADRNGNTTQLSYDGTNRLTTVTDAAGRHLYFGYANSSSYVANSVTSDFGLSLSYSYDGQGHLIQVTKPDQSILSFEYNSLFLITAVKDSDGKVLESHTYDSQGRGLTSSRANGVDSITVSYPQTTPPTSWID